MVNLAACLAVALPLYSWPSAGVWDPTYHIIKSNPNTTFNVIVNPDSGPGSYPLDSEYVTGVAKLNSYPNVNTYGYLRTDWAKIPLSTIQSEVTTYSKWATYKAKDIHLDGIFVDEATDKVADLTYMKNLSAIVKKTMPKNQAKIWTNPGCAVDKSFYDYADTITAFESDYSDWQDHGSTQIKQALRAKSNVMILNYSGDSKAIAKAAQTLTKAGYYSALLMSNDDYQTYNTAWATFASSVDTN
ncbi:hypothetical protein H2203_002384 [Taxawa tesnikishii (nom. ined.)]|nr:hypothetical protein H2203_002384 [Dothideales sp. JES 119]